MQMVFSPIFHSWPTTHMDSGRHGRLTWQKSRAHTQAYKHNSAGHKFMRILIKSPKRRVGVVELHGAGD